MVLGDDEHHRAAAARRRLVLRDDPEDGFCTSPLSPRSSFGQDLPLLSVSSSFGQDLPPLSSPFSGASQDSCQLERAEDEESKDDELKLHDWTLL